MHCRVTLHYYEEFVFFLHWEAYLMSRFPSTGIPVMYCLLEVVSVCPEKLAPIFVEKIDWIKVSECPLDSLLLLVFL